MSNVDVNQCIASAASCQGPLQVSVSLLGYPVIPEQPALRTDHRLVALRTEHLSASFSEQPAAHLDLRHAIVLPDQRG
jgi:hypothetical protein